MTQSILNNSNLQDFVLIKTVLGQHTITAAELVGAVMIEFQFAHNLGFNPVVIGSFYSTKDGAYRDLPYVWRNSGTYYGGGAQVTESATIYIDRVDTTNIYVRMYYFDIFGLSYLASNTNLNFKFDLFQERIAPAVS